MGPSAAKAEFEIDLLAIVAPTTARVSRVKVEVSNVEVE
jgi:hypothetical protein